MNSAEACFTCATRVATGQDFDRAISEKVSWYHDINQVFFFLFIYFLSVTRSLKGMER